MVILLLYAGVLPPSLLVGTSFIPHGHVEFDGGVGADLFGDVGLLGERRGRVYGDVGFRLVLTAVVDGFADEGVVIAVIETHVVSQQLGLFIVHGDHPYLDTAVRIVGDGVPDDFGQKFLKNLLGEVVAVAERFRIIEGADLRQTVNDNGHCGAVFRHTAEVKLALHVEVDGTAETQGIRIGRRESDLEVGGVLETIALVDGHEVVGSEDITQLDLALHVVVELHSVAGVDEQRDGLVGFEADWVAEMDDGVFAAVIVHSSITQSPNIGVNRVDVFNTAVVNIYLLLNSSALATSDMQVDGVEHDGAVAGCNVEIDGVTVVGLRSGGCRQVHRTAVGVDVGGGGGVERGGDVSDLTAQRAAAGGGVDPLGGVAAGEPHDVGIQETLFVVRFTEGFDVQRLALANLVRVIEGRGCLQRKDGHHDRVGVAGLAEVGAALNFPCVLAQVVGGGFSLAIRQCVGVASAYLVGAVGVGVPYVGVVGSRIAFDLEGEEVAAGIGHDLGGSRGLKRCCSKGHLGGFGGALPDGVNVVLYAVGDGLHIQGVGAERQRLGDVLVFAMGDGLNVVGDGVFVVPEVHQLHVAGVLRGDVEGSLVAAEEVSGDLSNLGVAGHAQVEDVLAFRLFPVVASVLHPAGVGVETRGETFHLGNGDSVTIASGTLNGLVVKFPLVLNVVAGGRSIEGRRRNGASARNSESDIYTVILNVFSTTECTDVVGVGIFAIAMG